jgi:hypothetical protein
MTMKQDGVALGLQTCQGFGEHCTCSITQIPKQTLSIAFHAYKVRVSIPQWPCFLATLRQTRHLGPLFRCYTDVLNCHNAFENAIRLLDEYDRVGFKNGVMYQNKK